MIRSRLALALCAGLALAGCDNGAKLEAEKQARHAALQEREATERLANLRQMQSIGRDDLALTLADDLVQRFPGTRAAAEAAPLRQTLRAKVEAESEARRLKGLWAYHSTDDKEAGGVVRTAYLYSSNSLGAAEGATPAPRARLVLRRHPQWGDDVYLLSERGHFACSSPCTVSVQFDQAAAVVYPAKLPETGEPAMFVEDFRQFVGAMPGSKRVRFEVTLADGSKHQPEFELAGYDPATIGRP